MSDLIRRSDAIAAFIHLSQGAMEGLIYKRTIDAIPAVDAVEVVRCRECKSFCKGANESESWEWCDLWKKDCWEDCYCACGQRREDGDT